MTKGLESAQNLVANHLRQIAPDIDLSEIDKSADLREEFDIDSIDFLNLVTALGKSLNSEIPEVDYPRLMTFDGLLKYAVEKMPQ